MAKTKRKLENFTHCSKIQQEALASEESTAGVMYLFMRMHPKNCCTIPLKGATTLLSGSKKGAVGA